MFFHGNDRKKLHQHISPTHLPADYGGELPALNYSGKDWFPCVKDHEEHIRLWNTYGFASSNWSIYARISRKYNEMPTNTHSFQSKPKVWFNLNNKSSRTLHDFR